MAEYLTIVDYRGLEHVIRPTLVQTLQPGGMAPEGQLWVLWLSTPANIPMLGAERDRLAALLRGVPPPLPGDGRDDLWYAEGD